MNLKIQNILWILILFISNFYTLDSFSQAETPLIYRQYLNLNKNSKKIKEAKIQKSVEVITANSKTDTAAIYYFDNMGNIIQELIRMPDTTSKENKYFYLNYSYKYDKDNRLIEKIDSTNNILKKTELEYDDNGTITKEVEYDSKYKRIREISYDYDALLRLIESTEINTTDKIITTYAYDSYSNMTKVNIKNSSGDAGSKSGNSTYVYKYDNKDNIIEKQTLIPGGGYKTETFKYDSKGVLTESYEISGRDTYTEFIYYYDKSFNKIKVEKTETSGDNKSSYTELISYDNFGNVIEDQNKGSNSEIISGTKYFYEYYK